jgi:hypothetical protein
VEKVNHIIQKQVLEVEMENPADAFQFRQRLGEVYHEKILPQLEDLFDEIGTTEKLIRVEKLQIDIGDISSKDWETTLSNKIISEVRQLLNQQHVQWIAPVADVPLTKDSNASKKDRPQTHFKYPVNDAQSAQKTLHEFENIFLFFLKNGRLPWYVPNTIQLKDLLSKPLFSDAIELMNSFLKSADSQSIIRLIYQVEENVLDEIVEKLIAQHQSVFYTKFLNTKPILAQISRSLLLNKPDIKKILYLPFFTAMYSNEESDFAKLYAKKFTSMLMENFPGLVSKYVASINTIDGNSNSIIENIKVIFAAKSASYKNQSDRQLLISKDNADRKFSEQTSNNLSNQKDDQFGFKMNNKEAVEIYIDNAGLVILHPFFVALFNQLNITVNDCFTIDYARNKAVLLTQFLVNGLEFFEEQHLVLNKILCGIPIDEPIFMELEITNEERKEAADLLSQIILLWTKNGNQVNGTIEGLQQSFLQRPGKLIKKGDDWQLQVEQRAYDMLLSSLPWGIGIVKSNWMKGMLWVDWA